MDGQGRWRIAAGVMAGLCLAASLAVGGVAVAALTTNDVAAASTGVCREAETLDPYYDPGQDIIWVWASKPHCEDLWQIAVKVFSPFFFDRDGYANMRFFGTEIDTDNNAATGCRGGDYRVEHDGSVGRVFRTPGCDTATWTVTSGAQLYFNNHSTTDAFMQWPQAAIGDPSGPIGFRTYIVDTRGRTDVAPDSGFLIVPAATRTYDANGPEGTIYRLYRAYFLREPDAGGFDYWNSAYAMGYPLASISNDFARSEEFQSRYGNVDDRRFLELVYANVLGRSPDQGGYAYWLDQMDRGMLRGFVMIYFSDSAEFRDKTAGGTPPGYT